MFCTKMLPESYSWVFSTCFYVQRRAQFVPLWKTTSHHFNAVAHLLTDDWIGVSYPSKPWRFFSTITWNCLCRKLTVSPLPLLPRGNCIRAQAQKRDRTRLALCAYNPRHDFYLQYMLYIITVAPPSNILYCKWFLLLLVNNVVSLWPHSSFP